MPPAGAPPEGWRLFARYAYAPNARGYCGPPEGAALEAVARGGGIGVDVPALARRFSGAWPYHVLIAELAGIEDPLDPVVVRAYWTGNALTRATDARRLGELLLARFASQAGHYWQHLDDDLLDEVTPTHVFHVLGVYPWSRLLARGRPEPLQVLDSCRIRAGEVVTVEPERLQVRARRLAWDGRRLSLDAPAPEWVGWWPEPAGVASTSAGAACAGGAARADGPTGAGGPRPGDTVAIHWRHACDRLTPGEVAELDHWTDAQVAATNRRLAAGAGGA